MANFVIYKDAIGQYRWRLIARNGEIIAVGEAYVSKQGAIDSIVLVKKMAQLAQVLDNTRTY
jgi:hypothetical protein